jgi:hypothetical protein|tara:strand:- start:1330 stop:3003 length:1674 start_codon:yes stop_codon:yes gene_type:complete
LKILTEAEKLQYCLERDRLLCSTEFARSPTMSKLLRFLVDHKLSDDGKPLTAYTVAVDGLGRDDSFDTQIDSYPRVQVGRLRRMLDHFYLREKGEDRLFIPYQHYEIILGKNDSAEDRAAAPLVSILPEGQSSEAPGQTDKPANEYSRGAKSIARGYLLAAVGALTLLAIAALFYLPDSDGESAVTITYPSVIVKTAEGMTSASSRSRMEMTQSYLIGALEKFDQLRVFDEDAAPTGQSQYLLETSVLDDPADRINLRLVAADSREVIWSGQAEMTAREADLDKAVVEIAGSYGEIAQHELSRYRGDFMPGYPCLLQFHQYMRHRDTQNLEPVLACMDRSARKFPNDVYLMSMLAIAKNLGETQNAEKTTVVPGKEFALRAAKLDGTSASAVFAVAQSAFFEGDCRRGVSWGERAVSLNPLNSRIMGYLGIYMLACKIPEGEAYVTRALDMDANVDVDVAATVALQKLRRGDVKAAQELSSKYMDFVPGTAVGLEISYILASAGLDEKEEARRAWRVLAERSGFEENAAPRKVLTKFISNPALVSELETDFDKADLY